MLPPNNAIVVLREESDGGLANPPSCDSSHLERFIRMGCPDCDDVGDTTGVEEEAPIIADPVVTTTKRIRTRSTTIRVATYCHDTGTYV